MTTQQKIDYLKADLFKAHRDAEPVSIAIPRETAFNLAAQFTADAVKAINASPAAVKAIHAAHAGGSSSLGVAHDLLGCVLAGEDNTSECNHSGVDHIDMARQCLENYAKEESARKQRRAAVGQPVVGVRFV